MTPTLPTPMDPTGASRAIWSLLLASWLLASGYLPAQGALDPPPGPPAPGMKTLQQIEPRIDVATLPGDANYHHVITARGSYYLTGDIDVTLAHGIDIRVSRVWLDLGGFTVRRTSGSGGNGVEISPNAFAVTLRNGGIADFAKGVSLTSNSGCRLSGLHIRGGTAGISFSSDCLGNMVVDCSITGTAEEGIEFTTAGNSCSQNLIQRCIVTKTGGYGIEFDGSGTGFAVGNAILDSTISETGDDMDGIILAGGNANMNGNLLSRCTIDDAGDDGVELNANNAFLDGNILSDLTISKAASHGVNLISPSGGNVRGNLVQRLTVSDPFSSYVNLEVVQGGSVSGNVVRDCLGRDGGTYGIDCDGGTGLANFNRFEGNHFSRVPPGGPIFVFPKIIITANCAENFIWRNSGTGYTGYTFDPDDTVGPVVTASGVLGTSGTSAHPWANFSR